MTLKWPVTGADVAIALRWPESRGEELDDYAKVAVAKIEEKVGPWHGQQLTHSITARTRRSTILLPWPVASVDEITVDGTAVAPLAVDEASGLVYGAFGPGTVTVTATARAADTIPPAVALAGRKLGGHLAKQEKVGPGQPGQAGSSDKDTDVLQGFALPRAVSELIADHVITGGFA